MSYTAPPPEPHSFPTRRSSDLTSGEKSLSPVRIAKVSMCPLEWAMSIASTHMRSEEHTSELQSLTNLVCRLLLEKKKLACTTFLRSELDNGVRAQRDRIQEEGT